MKRFFAALTAAFALCALLSLSTFAADRVLNVYNWGEYISDGSEGSLDVNAEFEKWYAETYGETVKVVYTTYASNEDLYAKLKSGAAGYDVILPSDYMIARMIDEGMLEKLNFDNIPNYAGISENFRGLYYDANNEYSVPFSYGMVGIIYDTTVVDEADIGTWDLMWNEKYKGKILQFNNSRDAFGTAMYRAGIDVNTTDAAQWQVALDALKAQKPILQGYVMDEVFNKMEGGEAAVAAYYAGDYLSMVENNENLGFYYPTDKDGRFATNLFVDAYCIPKGAANKDLAEAYINFSLSEEIAVANAEVVCYASPNAAVYESETYREDMGDEAMEILYPADFDFGANYNKMSYHNLDAETLATINTLWEELMLDGGMGAAVYIIAAVIVAAIVAFVIYRKTVQRKREKMYE